MPDIDAELSELQRRAYGPGGDDLSAPERARLAQLEAARRIPDPPWGHDASGDDMRPSPNPDAAISSPRSATGAAIPPRPPQPAARIRDGVDTARVAERRRQRLRRLFTPALIATIGVASVIVMLAAGIAGWGGGYAAGVARHAGPGDPSEFVAELHPMEMPERFAESGGGFYVAGVNPETGELEENVTYFGSIGDDIEIMTHRQVETNELSPYLPPGTVCLQVVQILEQAADSMYYAGGSACGSPRLDISVDLFTGADDEEYPSGMRLRTSEYPEDTLLRFTYSAARDRVTVWSLAPSE